MYGLIQRIGAWFKKHVLKSRIAVGLICVLIFSYTLYHLIGAFDGEISTFAAGVTTEKTTLNYDGYVFRDETVLYAGYDGLSEFHAPDGTKVSEGQAIATVYESGTHAERETLRRLDEQIALLQSGLSQGSAIEDPTELRKSVSSDYDQLIKMLASGESGRLNLTADRFLSGLNRLNALAEGENAEPAKTLTRLETERSELIASAGNGVTYYAEKSGYFYTETDGYESSFTMSAAEALTAESFYHLIGQAPEAQGNQVYGKISYSSEWRLVLPIAPREQKYFEVGVTYMGLFEENNRTELPLTVEQIISATEYGTVLVVFSCDRLPEHFSYARCQSVRLTVDSVSGIYVPRDVTTRQNGGRGVYILRGNVVYFRYIEILYEGSDYYLVKEGVEADGEFLYLQVNDLIILKGKNLFDGRVLE